MEPQGMLPRSGLLHKREAYGRYAADIMGRGQEPLPFEQWLAAIASQAPITPAVAPMGERTAPAGSIEERIAAREEAELQARRAAELEAMRNRAVQGRQGRVVR